MSDIIQVLPEKYTAFTREKPEMICEDCGASYEPVGYSQKLGWPKFQTPLCKACCDRWQEDYNAQQENQMKESRIKNLFDIAVEQGAPPDKVRKVKSSDFDKLSFKIDKKVIDVNRLYNAIKNGHQFLISGETDSGKTHLTTYFFLELLREIYQLSSKQFNYAYDYKIYNQILETPYDKPQIIGNYKFSQILFLTFGEYSTDLINAQGQAVPLAKEILFNILDYRIEYNTKNRLYKTIYVTTFDGNTIEKKYGSEIKNRLYEKSYLIKMEQQNYRTKAFKERPQIIVS